MPHRVKVRRIGSSLGVLLPRDLVAALDVAEGDALCAVRTPDGLALSRFDPDFEAALEASREFLRRYPNALRKLAEG